MNLRIFLLVLLLGSGFAYAQPATTTTEPATVTSTSPAATQNTITTSGPVKSETTISVGTLATNVLEWMWVVLTPILGGMAAWAIQWIITRFKLQVSDSLRARLQEIVINGLNYGAHRLEGVMQGKAPIQIKSEIIQQAVAYTQEHAADTIKALGLDPQSGEAAVAIRARIETAIADPTAPTPAVLAVVPAASVLKTKGG